MPGTDAKAGRPSDARFQDPRLQADVLEFLRDKAFPTWDFFDTAARRQLLREYPGQRTSEAVARDLGALGPLLPHPVPPGPLRPVYQIGATALRPPAPARVGLFGRVQRPDNSPAGRDSGVSVMVLNLSALGPFGSVTWIGPERGLDPLLERATLATGAVGLLRNRGITVLTRDELLVPVRGMRGTPYGQGQAIPDVHNCLFDEVSFRMRGLGAKGFRFQPTRSDDLWPPIIDAYSR